MESRSPATGDRARGVPGSAGRTIRAAGASASASATTARRVILPPAAVLVYWVPWPRPVATELVRVRAGSPQRFGPFFAGRFAGSAGRTVLATPDTAPSAAPGAISPRISPVRGLSLSAAGPRAGASALLTGTAAGSSARLRAAPVTAPTTAPASIVSRTSPVFCTTLRTADLRDALALVEAPVFRRDAAGAGPPVLDFGVAAVDFFRLDALGAAFCSSARAVFARAGLSPFKEVLPAAGVFEDRRLEAADDRPVFFLVAMVVSGFGSAD